MKRARPTKRHRPAIVPGILGTVYGINAEGEARYFDYDRAAAEAFAGVSDDRDPRFYKISATGRDWNLRCSYVTSGATEANPRVGTPVIWVLR